MAMTPLPTPPSRQDPANFAVRGDALMAALPLFVAEANALQEDVTVKQSIASSAVDMAMANGNYKGLWSSLTGALAIPASVQYGGFVWMLLSDVADVTAEQPGVSSAWTKIESAGNLGSAAYNNTEDFQAAFGTLLGLVRANGDGTVSAATAAQIVAAIGLTAVAYANSATTAGTCTGNAASATTAAACSGNAASATVAGSAGNADSLGSYPAANYPRWVNADPAVRQTVLSGPVDSSGNAAFGGSTGASTVVASGTLTATAAAGGDNNRNGSITNPSWSGLSTDGAMYLYLDIAADGTCTPGATTLAPAYQWGGAYSTTNGQFTYNIQEGTGKVGNGSSANQAYRVFVGEVMVASGVVAAITWYALRGKALIGQASLATSSAYAMNHNIGVPLLKVVQWLECISADNGYAVGDRLFIESSARSGDVPTAGGTVSVNSKTANLSIGTSLGAALAKSAPGYGVFLTIGNWKFGALVERGF